MTHFPQVRINVPLRDFFIITKWEMHLRRKHPRFILRNPSKIPFSLPLLSVPGHRLWETEKYVPTLNPFLEKKKKGWKVEIKQKSHNLQYSFTEWVMLFLVRLHKGLNSNPLFAITHNCLLTKISHAWFIQLLNFLLLSLSKNSSSLFHHHESGGNFCFFTVISKASQTWAMSWKRKVLT